MILYQHRIYRRDLRNNPSVLYLFGDNTLRKGMGGQAAEMRGEPNSCGVATKLTPTSGTNAYMSDDDLGTNIATFKNDLEPAFEQLIAGGIVVIPSDGLGTGLSAMPEKCPKSFRELEKLLGYLHETVAK